MYWDFSAHFFQMQSAYLAPECILHIINKIKFDYALAWSYLVFPSLNLFIISSTLIEIIYIFILKYVSYWIYYFQFFNFWLCNKKKFCNCYLLHIISFINIFQTIFSDVEIKIRQFDCRVATHFDFFSKCVKSGTKSAHFDFFQEREK